MGAPQAIMAVGALIASNKKADAAEDAAAEQAAAAEFQGEQEYQVALENAEKRRRTAKALIAKQRVLFAKAGVQSQGTPEEVLAQTAAEEELNALSILSSGQMSAEVAKRNAAARRKDGSATSRGIRSSGTVSALSILTGK